MSAPRAVVFGSLTPCVSPHGVTRQLRISPHGALPPSSPGVPFALVSAVCLLLQVYNPFTSKSAIER